MSRFNTGNPLGSADPRDRDDNSKNLDLAVNDRANDQWADRFGVMRWTYSGMERAFDFAQDARASDFSSSQAQRDADFNSSEDERSLRFNQFLAASGYQPIGDYETGMVVTEYNQIFRYEGSFFRVSPSVELPFTATDWITDSPVFIGLDDATLRQELAGPSGGDIVSVTTMTGTQTLTDALDSRIIYADSYTELPDAEAGRIAIVNGVVYRYTGAMWINGSMGLKISDYLNRFESRSEALKAAIVDLYTTENQVLDLEGLQILIESPVIISHRDLNFNSGLAFDCVVMNGWIKAATDGATWAPFDALVTILPKSTNTNGQLARNPSFVNVTFDASYRPQVKCFQISGYYNAYFGRCKFKQFTHEAFWSTGQAEDGTIDTSNGLVFDHCWWVGQAGQNGPGSTKVAALLYDTDIVFKGGFIEWVNTGIDAHRGSLKINNVHFSMGDTAGLARAFAIIRDPRNINITNNDIDGARLIFTNQGNYQGDSFNGRTNQRGITITGNQWDSGIDLVNIGEGFVTFFTEAPNTRVTQFHIADNEVYGNNIPADNSIPLIRTRTVGEGSFRAFIHGGTQLDGFGIINDGDGRPIRLADHVWIQQTSPNYAVMIGNYNNAQETLSTTPTLNGRGLLVSNGLISQFVAADTQAVWKAYQGTTLRMQMLANGDITNSNNAFGGLSDKSLKENIRAAGSQWEDIKRIDLKRYNFIGSEDRQLGVIAQEVEGVSPGLVSEDPETGIKSVKYSILYLKALGALKEAMDRIEALEEKINNESE